MPVASNGVIAGLVHLTAHQCVERWLERWLRRRGEPGSAAQRPRGARAAPRTATTRAARVQLDRLAPDMPAARSTSTRTLRVCVADCALLDRGLGRQRRVSRGMEPLFRVTTSSTHVVAGGRGRGHVLWPYPPRLRPVLAIVVKGDFPETFSVYLELMEVGEGRTKIPSVGKFYE